MRKSLMFVGGAFKLVGLYLLIFHWGESTGKIWASIDPNSIVGFGSLIENRVDPDLWLNVILPALQWQAWILPLGLGFFVVLVAQLWKRQPDERVSPESTVE